MADHDRLTQTERWRERADQSIAMARNAREAEARERLLKVARCYRRLAVRAQVGHTEPTSVGTLKLGDFAKSE